MPKRPARTSDEVIDPMRQSKPILRRLLAIAAVSILATQVAGAQTWPARAITIDVAFPPSTTTDFAARAVAQELSRVLGQPVIVENRTGGGGVIASTTVAKAPPDGYTLLVTTIGPAVLRPLIDRKVGYDAVADFTPIALLGEAPNVIVVAPQRGFTSVRDIVAYAKQNPGKLTVGHPGVGTMGHLVGLLFAFEAGIEVNFISYNGSPPIIADLLGGHIDVGTIAYGPAIGAAKALAVTTDEPLSFLPGVPTMKDGGLPNVTGATWSALFGPAGLPAGIVARLNGTIAAFLAKTETQQQFDKLGFHALGGPPERLRSRMAEDRAKWSKVITAAKLSLEP
jgi:tripartite-type tricarboxylate transporter receptor subunit TctC